jgi:hypothetical protein
MKVFILKEGKEYNQGVAYLDDGTMVVVDNARKMISKTIDIVVTSVLQTTAGKMIFGRYIEPASGRVTAPAAGTSDVRDGADGRRRPRPTANVKLPPYHWWRTVFFLIPAITVYTVVLGAGLDRLKPLGSARLLRASLRRGWSFLILKTTGVRVTVEGLERVTPVRPTCSCRTIRASTTRRCCSGRCHFSCGSSRRSRWQDFRCSAGTCGAAAICSSIVAIPIAPGFWPLAVAGLERVVADDLCRGTRSSDGHTRALQGRQFPAGNRGGAAGGADRRHRHATGDAEKPSAH